MLAEPLPPPSLPAIRLLVRSKDEGVAREGVREHHGGMVVQTLVRDSVLKRTGCS